MTSDNTTPDLNAAYDVLEMIEEIGMSDDTIIPIWPIDTEMALTHPFTVGMARALLNTRAALQQPVTDAERQQALRWFEEMMKKWSFGFKPEEYALKQTIRRALSAPQGTPPGWKLVPIEPTTAMSNEGAIALSNSGYGASQKDALECYKAMIEAAPDAETV